MSRYLITRRADRDLDEIWQRIARDRGSDVADRIDQEFHEQMSLLADHPKIGHHRADVKNRHYRFWPLYSFVIVYRFERKPITVSRVLHGARVFRRIIRQPEMKQSERDDLSIAPLAVDQSRLTPSYFNNPSRFAMTVSRSTTRLE